MFLSIGSGADQKIINKSQIDLYKAKGSGSIIFTDFGNYESSLSVSGLNALLKDNTSFKKFTEVGNSISYINIDRIILAKIKENKTLLVTINGDIFIEDSMAELETKLGLKKQFKVIQINQGKILKESYYSTDNGDGTYSNLIEEIIYNYANSKIISKERKIYDVDETLQETKIINYFSNNKNKIEKEV